MSGSIPENRDPSAPPNLQHFLGQLEDLVGYVRSVDGSRRGEAALRGEAEARAQAEKARADEASRLLGLLEARVPVIEEEKRQAVSRTQALSRNLQALSARLSEREAEAGATALERDQLKATLADITAQKLAAEKQFAEILASHQRQLQTSVAKFVREREELTTRLDQMRRETQDLHRELHELRLSRDQLLTETQREAEKSSMLQKQVDSMEKTVHQAQAERARASELARASHSEAFEARDRAELLERRLRTLEQLVGTEPSGRA